MWLVEVCVLLSVLLQRITGLMLQATWDFNRTLNNYNKVKFKLKDILFYAFSLLWLQRLFLFLTK